MTDQKADLLKGTLDMLILKAVSLGPLHGYGIIQRIRQMSGEMLDVEQGSLYPALYRIEQRGWVSSQWEVSETGRRASFLPQTLAAEGIAHHAGRQGFQGDKPGEASVVGEVDDAHAALAQYAAHDVRPDDLPLNGLRNLCACVVGSKQFVDSGTQLGLTAAGAIQVLGPLLRIAIERSRSNRTNPPQLFEGHD